jgi:hypothetical protein
VLRYVKFHPKQPHCEHCNAGLLKGAVELSDGKKYGRDCAARAMGKPRESASMKKYVDDLRKQAIRAEYVRGYRACQEQKAGWTWQGMGYGGNAGWPLTHHYLTQTGESVLETEVFHLNVHDILNTMDVILGEKVGFGTFLKMTPEQANEVALEAMNRIQWTKVQSARWTFGKGWDA